ncbi:13999_t:CDS:2, partial [Ambispora leptoticha]
KKEEEIRMLPIKLEDVNNDKTDDESDRKMLVDNDSSNKKVNSEIKRPTKNELAKRTLMEIDAEKDKALKGNAKGLESNKFVGQFDP